MPKRKSDKTISYYREKIRKLKENADKNRKRKIYRFPTSSSDSEEPEEIRTEQEVPTQVNDELMLPVDPMVHDLLPNDSQDLQTGESVLVELAPPTDLVTTETIHDEQLNPDLLSAIGDAADEQPVFGENIHITLAQRWLPILKKGLNKELKDKISKEYLFPENCKMLKAPSLNPEIAAAVPDIVRNRDKNIEVKQNQLGIGISAVSKAITLLLLSDDKLKAIKFLSDSCRILNDLHYTETQLRTKLITPGLEKSFLPIIQDQERDDTLFGSNLPENIKASKAIERQGQQIKKPTQRTSSLPASVAGSSSSSKYRHQGNWQAPPRYTSSNRGGRGGAQVSAYRRPMQVSTPSSNPTRAQFNVNKRRVPTRR